jgi:carboxymethylenebutenolidase
VTDEIFKAKVGAAIDYLKGQQQFSGKIGVVGFCMGGGNALKTACLFGNDVQACSMFYGRIPDLKLLEGLEAPVIGNFGGEDKNITEWAIHELRPAMQNMNKSLNMKVYPGAPHAFASHNMANRYKPEAAEDAWDRTYAFFGRTLNPAGAAAGGGRRQG